MKHIPDLAKLFPNKTVFKLGFSWICLRKSVKCKMQFNIFIKNARFIRKQFMWLSMCCFYKLVKFICLSYSMKFELNMRVKHCRKSKLCLIYKGNGKGHENEKSWLFEFKSPSVKCVITPWLKARFRSELCETVRRFCVRLRLLGVLFCNSKRGSLEGFAGLSTIYDFGRRVCSVWYGTRRRKNSGTRTR